MHYTSKVHKMQLNIIQNFFGNICYQFIFVKNNMNPIIKIEIKQTDIFNIFFNISYKTAIGSDKVSTIFLNKFVFIVTTIITYIFKKILSSNIFQNQ